MQTNPQIKQLDQAVSNLKTCIQDLPESKFLQPINGQPINGWTPRDVIAHLIGWNRHTITGCRQIKTGELPSYFSDAENDFSNVNAESLDLYAKTDQGLLLDELEDSSQALQNYLLFLDPDDWQTDFGVRYRDSTITIENTVAALIKDYDDHREEIQTWVKIQKDQ
jgi:hypothetical protein